MLLVHLLSVDRRNVSPARVPVSKPRDIGSESPMRKARVTGGRLGRMAESTCRTGRGAGRNTRSWVVLHPEKMRGDKAVPRDVG